MGQKRKRNAVPVLPEGISIVDTHCHLDMIDSADAISTLVTKSAARGVAPIITVGIDLESCRRAIRLAAQYETVYATVGIHPHSVNALNDRTYAELEKLCRKPKVVAYGEIGLDYVKQYAPKHLQLEHYARQVDLAKQMELPVVIHDRGAHEDILHILKSKIPFPAGGVMHCFSGDWQFAKKILDLDFLISIPGIVTFTKADTMKDVAQKIPLDKLILETDAPFLAPEPFRGRKNIPEYVLYTAQKIAALRSMSLEDLARTTTENALQLFNIMNH